MLLSIVVPCYNEQEVIPFFLEELYKITDKMKSYQFEIVFVNDGSTDRTLHDIKNYARTDAQIRYVSFSRNFGKESAIYAGLHKAKGDLVAVMDADLQDPPSLLPDMCHAVEAEGYDAAATRRSSRRGEPVVRSVFAKLFYKLINKMTEVEIVDGARDFRVMSRKYVNALLGMKEYNRFSKGLYSWVGFRVKWFSYENVQRAAGHTKWSFWSLFQYSIEGIAAFTTTPLVLASFVGLILCICTVLAVLFIIVRRIVFGDPVDGWASLACLITFMGGCQMFFFGIMGQYIAKMYLENKRRPIYIVDEETDETDHSAVRRF
ncbi:putative glycosyltransferase CsbB [Eubacterium plexicaudatum ASF492]|uniref:Glycosyltransferase 2-like domain-containing protein n=1 Tax=Eubacterium plexicaudatum ASF492 TaxID=1235802 RepID=N2AFU1_9FIRM|nr:putative glycosyltransferase CsbB [Eubacterium plexicaudatum ASF492]